MSDFNVVALMQSINMSQMNRLWQYETVNKLRAVTCVSSFDNSHKHIVLEENANSRIINISFYGTPKAKQKENFAFSFLFLDGTTENDILSSFSYLTFQFLFELLS